MLSESVVQRQVPLVGIGFDRQMDCLASQTWESASVLAESVVVAQVAAEFAAVLLVETVQEPFVPKLVFPPKKERTQ